MVQDATQDADNGMRKAGDYTFAERYKEGKLAVHLHVGVGIVGIEGESCDLCAVCKGGIRNAHLHSRLKLSQRDNLEVAVLISLADMYFGSIRNSPDGVQDSMPVNPREFIEVPEPVILGGPADLERLQLLDTCPVFRGEVSNLVFASLSSKGALGVADRERRLTGRFGAFSGQNCKLPGQMVEGGSHVLQTVANDGAEIEREFFDYMNPIDVFAAIGLSLIGDSIRLTLEKSEDLTIQHYQVLLCSSEL